MRMALLVGWLMVPALVGAYHYGPGQEELLLDDVAQVLAAADRDAGAGQWSSAVERYDQALTLLPPGRPAQARRIRLERDKAQMFARQLPEANLDLEGLVEELEGDEHADPALREEARSALANSQYYITWLMRLEGLAREEWEPEIESARQTYRLLAEQADRRGDSRTAARWREDLESAIRVARMEPGDLQGLSIPKQCQGCKSGQCKGKKPGRKPNGNKSDDARGASSGPPPDRSGS